MLAGRDIDNLSPSKAFYAFSSHSLTFFLVLLVCWLSSSLEGRANMGKDMVRKKMGKARGLTDTTGKGRASQPTSKPKRGALTGGGLV
jgi:hypothetical protein